MAGLATLTRTMQVFVLTYTAIAAVIWALGWALPDAIGLNIGLSMVMFILLALAATFFGLWLAQAYAAAPEPGNTPGWTIASWYIPIANIGTPYAPTLALWRRATGGTDAAVWTWLIAWSLWWTFSLIGAIASMAVSFDAAMRGTPMSASELPVWLHAWGAMSVAAAIVAAIGLTLAANRLRDAVLARSEPTAPQRPVPWQPAR